MLVEVEHQVVGDDRVAGGEERDQPADQVPLGRRQPGQVGQVGVQVDLLDRPGVLDRVAEPVVELRVAHRAQGQVHARVEQQRRGRLSGVGAGVGGVDGGGHWQASQASGFSSEQAMAASSAIACVRHGRRWPVRGGRRRPWPAGSGSPGASAGSRWSSGPAFHAYRYIEDSLPMVGAARNRFSDWLWSMNGAAGRGHVDQRPLRQLPGGAEQLADVVRQRGDALHRAVGALDRVADLGASTARAPSARAPARR